MAPILKLCKYYFELEPVFGTRHANVRLAATRSLPATSRNVESKDDGQIQRDAREHSINSNLAYEMDQNGSKRTQLEEGMNGSLVNDSHLPNEDSDAQSDDITMEEMRRVMNDNFDETPGISDTYTPIRAFQSSQTRSQPQLSSSSLKRTSSKHSLESASQSTMSKRARQSGSASSIQGLFEGRNYGSSSAGADTFTSTIEREAVINHGKNMDRLTQLAVNMNTAMFGQPTSQPVLSEEQIQKKSSIEIELADVKLSSERFDLDSRKEKHLLEIQQMKAEMEHQQVSRNAQLISTLMRDHNMNIHDAMLAAQQAQAMVQSSSSAT
ncbi:uncharacterized protein MELLADRAFT_87591 [Melampsora larici-populina 98AG31]|uniref:Uncharacterized protein n=1 Tax=Melampsora larici-populina (strain 98AG31 / pathotype 3-4-7) TaxID=747676 RepID=F4RNZ9_MELLP|nr:uncharacterized protein MELLADRAFT_87591 [Melampsora larici-populina 98AG31]EGG05941.1 hypothetical protein MELLADRAFT_87591 [Melampsora larici-populina 98AG31]